MARCEPQIPGIRTPHLGTTVMWIGIAQALIVNVWTLTAIRSQPEAAPGGGATSTLWGQLFGLPVSAWAIFVLAMPGIAGLLYPRAWAKFMMVVAATVLVLAPLWFLSIMLFVLERMCTRCMAAHLCGWIAAAGAAARLLMVDAGRPDRHRLITPAAIGLGAVLLLSGYQLSTAAGLFE